MPSMYKFYVTTICTLTVSTSYEDVNHKVRNLQMIQTLDVFPVKAPPPPT